MLCYLLTYLLTYLSAATSRSQNTKTLPRRFRAPYAYLAAVLCAAVHPIRDPRWLTGGGVLKAECYFPHF